VKLFRPTRRKPSTSTHALRRRLEALEDRDVPSALSVADVMVREGPTSIGILDPAGAASVGINGIWGVAFDTGPSDSHFGDLFVTGLLSHSVARFDWASQAYQPFVAPNSGGLNNPYGIEVGPDGNVYVSDSLQNIVFRYDGSTGAPLPATGQTGAVFVAAGSGGLLDPRGITFGPDGNLYVCSRDSNVTGQILEYQGPAGPSPGAYVRVFTNISNGSAPCNLTFGPDGNFYVSLIDMNGPNASIYGQVNRYDGLTGAPIGTGVFVPQILQPRGIVFDPTGTSMYVIMDQVSGNSTPLPAPVGQVLRYQGPNAPSPGAFVETYIPGGESGLGNADDGLARDAAGNLYVADRLTANVTRFAPSSQASFVVTLDSASTGQVSVDYSTADGSAVAGTDYTPISGTLTFPAGVTSETVSVPITTIATGGPTKTFTLNLSNPVNATIADGLGVASILNRQTKFFVVDSGTVKTYQYGSGGTSEEISAPRPYASNTNTAPRGVATTVAGDKVWVVDANKSVYIYTNHGVLLGSWSVVGLSPKAQLTGITTDGSDIWLVEGNSDKVYKYAGAASRLSGSQSAASSFALVSGRVGNANPQDIVTDGSSFWVVDGTVLKVFKYSLSGAALGSWAIDPANAHPTGITINPNNVRDIWIVDNGALKVYQYAGAASRTSGSQTAAATFALNPYDTNPQGIADPPPTLSIGDSTAMEGSVNLKFLDRFIPEGSGGLTTFVRGSVFGPDGNHDGARDLYVANAGSNAIRRYDGLTGSFIDTFVPSGSGGLNNPTDLAFGPDGDLYVSSPGGNQILRFDGLSGAFLNVVAGGLAGPLGVMFGPDGSLYITNQNTNEVLRYRNSVLSAFVTAGSGGLNQPRNAQFGSDGDGDGVQDLYVASLGNGKILRYDGQTGAFIDMFASTNLAGPAWSAIGTNGYLYTTGRDSSGNVIIERLDASTGALDSTPLGRDGWSFSVGPENIVYDSSNSSGAFIERFGPSSLAAFTVSLDTPSTTPVTVQFATANSTAVASSDYTAASGTITFVPGETTHTILVRTTDDTLSEPTETFFVNLSNPVGATIARGQGVASIIDNEPLQVSSAKVNGGAVQRSRVTDITVTFTGLATLPANPADAFRLTRLGPDGSPTDVTLAVDLSASTATQTIARLTFGGALTDFGSLVDGLYRLRILAAQVSGSGQPLDGDANGTAGGDFTLDLHRLFGDFSGDKTVNVTDLTAFRNAFGATTSDPNYQPFLDFNGDGVINITDLTQFRNRFGVILP
jgi:sugar lactone lactonase YvrE